MCNRYQRILEHVASRLPDVRLNARVKHLRWTEKGVRAEIEGGGWVEADAVIITVSIGVMQSEKGLTFDPPLPSEYVNAFSQLDIGHVEKVRNSHLSHGLAFAVREAF